MIYNAYILGVGASLENEIFNTFSDINLDNDRLIGLEQIQYSNYIKKKRDLNNMSESQRLLAAAAGEAITTSVLSEQPEALENANIYTVCSIGERDVKVDERSKLAWTQDPASVNAEIARLRPTQLLMELANLYSANISILFNMCGESLTFIGEQNAASQAFKHAIEHSRTATESSLSLVGGVSNGSREIIKESINQSVNCIAQGRKFAKASASTLISTNEIHRDIAVAQVSFLGSYDESSLLKQMDAPHYISCLLTTELTMDIDSSLDLITEGDGSRIVNLTKRFGYLAEASLSFQFALAVVLLNKYSEKRFLVACQMVDGRYQTYEISK
ncbi:beta-ketoacyl synthase N-terminal-like domain-containing protein [Pseudoalteromonas ostreae]|uniref:beta-ketoacyl synthase N-terminal-like domain-containing protein n=1 Tax=Pseudoalteromonas ostreae TaxID=2774154 RepID=UPI001B36C566|nr:beta-ketoacyl synthase N-terminal-like domain-containing protein [Pseudoalteromonas ostreae]